MNTNKDLPSTWRKYEDGLCEGCYSSCCTMPVEIRASDLVRLGLATEDELNQSIKKVAKKLIRSGVLKSYREGTEFFMISQKANEDCWFLDTKTRKCTVYEKRPDTCRDFPTRVGTRVGYCPVRKLNR